MAIIVIMLLLLLPLLPVCCLGRTSRGLWDQLPVENGNQGDKLYLSGNSYTRRKSRGLWDQLTVEGDNLDNNLYSSGNIYMRSNVKKRTLAENTVEKIKVLERDNGFWGMILKMGKKEAKKQKRIKQNKRTVPRHSKSSKQILSHIKTTKTIKLKKRENKLLQVPR